MLTPLAPFTPPSSRDSSQNSTFDLVKASQPNQLKDVSYTGVRESKEDSFAIFNKVLQKAYERIAASALNPQSSIDPSSSKGSVKTAYDISDYSQVEKISPQQAADTILSFITQRIKLDQISGATQDELLQRLDQGLQGFIKGFNEAKDIIEGLGLLTPELSDEINDTFDRVTDGVNALREGINDIEN